MLAEMLSVGVLGASWKESWGPMWSSPRSSLFWSSPSVAGSQPGCSPLQGWRSGCTPKPWLVLGPIHALTHTHTQTLLSLFCACFCCAARLGSSLAAWWHTESFTGDAHGATAKLFTFNRGLSQGRSDTLPAICVFHRAQYTSPAPCSCVFLV